LSAVAVEELLAANEPLGPAAVAVTQDPQLYYASVPSEWPDVAAEVAATRRS
jgi:hypothetical protein